MDQERTGSKPKRYYSRGYSISVSKSTGDRLKDASKNGDAMRTIVERACAAEIAAGAAIIRARRIR